MSEDTTTEQKQPSELDLLREQATMLGISFSGNTGVDTLKKKIADKLADKPDAKSDKPDENAATAESAEKTLGQFRQEQIAEHTRLIRCRITCLNPAKADLRGEFIGAGNDIIGTIRKFVPYGEGSENGYHLEAILVNELRSRQFNQVKTSRGDKGQVVITQKLVNEYAIQELDPLTPKELEDLARVQAAAAGL